MTAPYPTAASHSILSVVAGDSSYSFRRQTAVAPPLVLYNNFFSVCDSLVTNSIMVIQRSIVAVATALSLVSFTQATNYEYPPCTDKYTPFTSDGCYTNADNALILRSSAPSQGMTVEKCTAICKGKLRFL